MSEPRRSFQRTSKFTTKSAKSRLGGEEFAFGDKVDRAPSLSEFREHFADLSPGVIGFEECAGHFTRLQHKRPSAERYFARRFLEIRQSFEIAEWGSAHSIAGLENPADGLTEVKCDAGPLL